MAAKRASQKAKSDNVFGQARKPAKMFRAGLYARVGMVIISLDLLESKQHHARRPAHDGTWKRFGGIRY